uniref:Protein kinase domain-containing protein n=1 Tax=Astatotilapia calliptera TaxID=8154 RepID=A0AAX7TYZ5_ASTCA
RMPLIKTRMPLIQKAFLGEGGFGIVAKCRDTMTNQAVAIKVNKSRPDILQQAKLEIFILEQLPILGQLTNALSHLGSLGIVHADLKPGNIMVVNRHESPIKVKLIDFGLACPASAVMPGDRVGTIGYSAPEVMLGLPYNEASDMWSLGLVAVELGTGVPLYPGNEDYDVLKFIIETQGQPPDHVLDSVMMFRRGPENGQRLFVSLIKQMLALDANQRITPSEVLRHPFFNPKSSPYIDMSAERPQNPVVFQHPSNLKCKRSEKINCSFQNSVEFSQQVFVHTSASPSFR